MTELKDIHKALVHGKAPEDQIKFGPQPEKHKENLALPAVEWDQLAFQLIKKELAPKGFSEIKRGPWRGKVQSNIEFLSKDTVTNCQKITAQMVRAFRAKAKKQLKNTVDEIDVWIKEDRAKLDACWFWQFKKKTDLRYKIKSLLGQGGSASRLIQELDNISIK